MINILITGGLGFIGSKIIKQLDKSKYSITIIDNKSSNVLEDYENCKILNIDLSDKEILKENFDEKFDIVLHLAGQSSGPTPLLKTLKKM